MRILAINDISCVGKCSLAASLPIISACGIECNLLPTALLSTHTGGFTGYTFRDLTEDFPPILAHWKKLGLTFDCIYSGYLGSMEQIDLILSIQREFLKEGGFFVVDPVMGDNGNLYAGFTNEYVEKMKELCKNASFILPNMTEACYLSGLPYPLNKESAKECLERLTSLCKMPIVTGITEENRISTYFIDELGTKRARTYENVEGFFCGAGDVFASAFVGCLMRGKKVSDAIRLSADFVTATIRRSQTEVPDKRFGLNFEKEIYPFLQKLNA